MEEISFRSSSGRSYGSNANDCFSYPFTSEKEPFISATDICTFRLYYNQTGSTKFAVYSPALSIYFVYELATNTITPTKDINFNSTPLSEKAAP